MSDDYTVRDPKTGRTVTLRGDSPPTEAELEHIFASLPAEATPATPSTAASLSTGLSTLADMNPLTAGAKQAYHAIVDNPVKSAAVAGSIAAPILTGGASILPQIVAAGLGAAGGAGAAITGRQLASGHPEPASDTLKTMGTEGALGAIGEAGGQLGSQALIKGGKFVYRGVLRPSAALQRSFGDIAETGIKEGFPVNERGLQAAESARGASANMARSLVNAAAPSAPPLRVLTEVGRETTPVIQRATTRASTGLPDEAPSIVGRIRAMQAANPGGIPLSAAQSMKDELQDLATSVYRAKDKGANVVDLGADTNAALARGLRSGIERRVPGVAEANTRTQSLIGASHALEDATLRHQPNGGIMRTLLGGFAPGATSNLAIAADRLGQTNLLPPALKAALIAALGGQQ